MADAMAHRGPDDEGVFVSGPVGLAHRRLSIIDLRGGHQPMFNEDGSICIVFNGEIYNHQELRSLLEPKGHAYRTTSDTESIVHAYEEFGADFESHLTGMFAFALWDGKRQRLILVRDRVGIKPLYYTLSQGRLIFASEIKAILAIDGIERQVDFDGLKAYLALRYVPGPKTLFRNIFKLPPGHTLTVDRGQLSIRSYWNVSFTEDCYTEPQALAELERLFFEVCQSHLMSEVPYGVFLSGGLDSSSVAAVLKAILEKPVPTFTVGYQEGDESNEFEEAQVISRHLGTEHHEILLPSKDFAEWIPELVWHLDEPVGDAACIPLYFLARSAKQFATVLHSGEGADELFAGYAIYKKMLAIHWMQGTKLQPFLNLLIRHLGPSTGQGKIARYIRLLGLPFENSYQGVSGHSLDGLRTVLLKSDLLTPSADDNFLAGTFSGHHNAVKSSRTLNRMLYVDLKTWLPDDLLVKADKMTMATSVELRVPFLDHRLVEFAARLPTSLKIRTGETKYLLKKVMERFLPNNVIYRRKKGFPVPLAKWFRTGLYGLAAEVLLSPASELRSFICSKALQKQLELHRQRRVDFSNELWALLVLDYWCRVFRVRL